MLNQTELVYFLMFQEMMHGQDVVLLEGDRVVKTLTDLITRG